MKISKLSENTNNYVLHQGSASWVMRADNWIDMVVTKNVPYVLLYLTMYGIPRIVCITNEAVYMNFKLWVIRNPERRLWFDASTSTNVDPSMWQHGNMTTIHATWVKYFGNDPQRSDDE